MRNYIRKSLYIIMTVTLILCNCIQANAHDMVLYVDYDECSYDENADVHDDLSEIWYYVTRYNSMYHLSEETTTIKYYFADNTVDGAYNWSNAVAPFSSLTTEEVNQIKRAYADSMEKWNNVYFYSYL